VIVSTVSKSVRDFFISSPRCPICGKIVSRDRPLSETKCIPYHSEAERPYPYCVQCKSLKVKKDGTRYSVRRKGKIQRWECLACGKKWQTDSNPLASISESFGTCKKCSKQNQILANGLCDICWDTLVEVEYENVY